MLLIYRAHEGSGRRQNLIDENEDGLLWGKLDALADDVDELAYGEVCGHEILLLVDSSDVRLLDLLTDDLKAVSIGLVNNERWRVYVRGCGQHTSGGCARPLPCASQRGARP